MNFHVLAWRAWSILEMTEQISSTVWITKEITELNQIYEFTAIPREYWENTSTLTWLGKMAQCLRAAPFLQTYTTFPQKKLQEKNGNISSSKCCFLKTWSGQQELSTLRKLFENFKHTLHRKEDWARLKKHQIHVYLTPYMWCHLQWKQSLWKSDQPVPSAVSEGSKFPWTWIVGGQKLSAGAHSTLIHSPEMGRKRFVKELRTHSLIFHM